MKYAGGHPRGCGRDRLYAGRPAGQPAGVSRAAVQPPAQLSLVVRRSFAETRQRPCQQTPLVRYAVFFLLRIKLWSVV